MKLSSNFRHLQGEVSKTIRTTHPDSPEGRELTHLIGEIYQTPSLLLEWSQKLYDAGQTGLSHAFARMAALNARHDRMPEQMLTQAARFLKHMGQTDDARTIYAFGTRHFPHNLFFHVALAGLHIESGNSAAAITLLTPLKQSGRADIVTINTLAYAYLHAGKPETVITLLKPLEQSGRGNIVTTNTLAKAYIHDGNPLAAISILKPLEQSGRADILTINTLANAYLYNRNPADATTLLKTLEQSGRGNIVTTNTLAKAYIHDGNPAAAIALLKPLVKNGRGDSITINTLANAYLHDGDPVTAIALLTPVVQSGRADIIATTTLANAHLYVGDPASAIALLKPLGQSGRGDSITTNTLANAHLHVGDTAAAIALLKPLEQSGRGDNITTNTLANAYVNMCDRKGFESLHSLIKNKSYQDYLHAKLCFFEHDTRRALAILVPYLQNDIRTVPTCITSLFMSCVGDESPLLDTIKKVVGTSHFDYLLERRDEWRETPARAELADPKLSNGHTLFELGGVPASKADRAKAGLGRETPVAAAPGLWRK